jgi:hypothetical protein
MIIAASGKIKKAGKAIILFPPESYAKKEEPNSRTRHRMINTITTI